MISKERAAQLRSFMRVHRVYQRIRKTTARRPPNERSADMDARCKKPDVVDNNPGRTAPAPDPDKL